MIGNWPKPMLIFASSVALPTSFMDGLLSDTFQKILLCCFSASAGNSITNNIQRYSIPVPTCNNP